MNSIHQFTLKDLKQQDVSLEKYKGKVLLIVNTASKCGLTPQYKDLEDLYAEFKGKDFDILAFPSNDFGAQEPLNGAEIQEFCDINFKTTFPLFDKVVVTGKDACPLFHFLSDKSLNGKVNVAPKWNFQKYLINKEGEVVDYYLPITSPTTSKIKKAISKLL
ncbi:MAG: glutathione peroxidase [Bacteroidota bacterium]